MTTLAQAPTQVAAPVTGTRTGDRHHRGALRWVVLVGCAVIAVLMLAPFVLMLINAFKSPADYSTHGPLSLPTNLYFAGLTKFWTTVDFPVKLWNSIWTSAAVSVLGTGLSLLTATRSASAGCAAVRGWWRCSCWPTCCRRRCCCTRCTRWPRRWA